MFNSGVLEVAMGLTFVYALLSLLCTGLGELIESAWKVRASNLERAIRTLLKDPEGLQLARELYEHPLIDGLFRGKYDPTQIEKGVYSSRSNLPSYIPANNFAQALLDIVMKRAPAATPGAGPAKPRASAEPDQQTASASTTEPSASAVEFGRLKRALEAMNSPQAPGAELAQALSALTIGANGDMAKLRANLESWFDSAMDRASGWYRRRAQWISVLLGVVVPIVVNADSLAIAQSLSTQPALRDSLVAQAREYATRMQAAAAAPNPNAALDACKRDENSTECHIAKTVDQVGALGLPLGWTGEAGQVPGTIRGRASKMLGWLITALAISLGAPFWFDVLNKLSIVRATVKPREKSPEEPPVDAP